MPKPVEDALRRQADKLAKSGKLKRRPGDSLQEAKDRFLWGTMRNMAKRGEIKPFGNMKH